MKPLVPLRVALEDPMLLGNALPGDSWRTWRTMLLALMGEPLEPVELEVYRKLTRRDAAPDQRCSEGAIIAGRRGGKSRALSVLAAYIAGLCEHSALVKGETGVCLLIAQDKDQAVIDLNYANAVFEGSPTLSKLVASRTADTLALKNKIEIVVRSPSFRRLRGRTAICVIADELSFWLGEDRSSNPDTEILAAVRPMLLTTCGPLLLASSPHAKKGALYEIWKRDFGPDGDPRVLVAQGSSQDFHPDLPDEEIARALERDPEWARSEYLGEWRQDLESFVSRETVEQCVELGVKERPFDRRYGYHAFFDGAGGSGSDSTALCIAHRENERTIIDVLRERRPPHSPAEVIADFAHLLSSYRINSVRSDAFAGAWPADEFRRHNIHFVKCEQNKSQLYQDFLPLLNTARVVLLDERRLVGQICGLERRVRFGGRGESIDHGPNAHDDLANVCAGAAVFADRGHTRAREHRPILVEGISSSYYA